MRKELNLSLKKLKENRREIQKSIKITKKVHEVLEAGAKRAGMSYSEYVFRVLEQVAKFELRQQRKEARQKAKEQAAKDALNQTAE
jgi:hypothetical protein